MSDRTSAGIYGNVFNELARLKSECKEDEGAVLECGSRLWTAARSHDFHPVQMECDDALISLHLADEDGEDEDGNRTVSYRKAGQ